MCHSSKILLKLNEILARIVVITTPIQKLFPIILSIIKHLVEFILGKLYGSILPQKTRAKILSDSKCTTALVRANLDFDATHRLTLRLKFDVKDKIVLVWSDEKVSIEPFDQLGEINHTLSVQDGRVQVETIEGRELLDFMVNVALGEGTRENAGTHSQTFKAEYCVIGFTHSKNSN